MVIMTEGLRGVAGDALQRVLRRFTRSPASGAAVGAGVTALVQSSSATTVSAVGFARAGLLTFPQALGIVFGANLGTTVTGWMVAILGFKLDLGLIMPVAILVGALVRLFGRRRIASAGYALAGFGLIFTGIAALQSGMVGLAESIQPELFPPDDAWGRLRLVGIGAALTLVTQSSSAGVATALAALSAGAISFPQAAALVIGMDVGTTATAAMATVGASLPARRTGWAHVIYNLMTGAAAFLILPLFARALELAHPGAIAHDPELSLVAFHTFFNAAGVLAILPAALPFARLVERLVPDRPGPFTRRLERSLLAEPLVALQAIAPTLDELARAAFDVLEDLLRNGRKSENREDEIAMLTAAVVEVEAYLGQLRPGPPQGDTDVRRASALHMVDQLGRLLQRLEQRDLALRLGTQPELSAWAARVAEALAAGADDAEARHGEIDAALEEAVPAFRDETAIEAGRGDIEVTTALDRMDALRWLDRVNHHAWRIVRHLQRLRSGGGAPEPAPGDLSPELRERL